MCYQFIVEFQVRRGMGPEYIRKDVPVAYDDIDPDVPEQTVKDWAKNEAQRYLLSSECPAFVFVAIHYT